MSIAAQVARVVANTEITARADEFILLAKAMVAASRGVSMPQLPERVQTILRSPITPGATSDPNWSALSQYTTIATAFLESLRGISVLDTLLANGMKQVPSKSRIAVVTAAVTGSSVAELSSKPISLLALTASDVAPRKSAAIVVASREVFAFSGGAASALFASELRGAVAVSTDTVLLAALYAGVTPAASAGSTVANILADIDALLSALTLGVSSRVFVVMSAANVAALLTKASSAGGAAFPLLTLNGGQILGGVDVIVSDAVPNGAIIAIDATGLAGNSELPVLRVLEHGNVELNTLPDNPATAATVLHNLWQHNEIGVFVERWFAFAKARTGAVSAISGATY